MSAPRPISTCSSAAWIVTAPGSSERMMSVSKPCGDTAVPSSTPITSRVDADRQVTVGAGDGQLVASHGHEQAREDRHRHPGGDRRAVAAERLDQ